MQQIADHFGARSQPHVRRLFERLDIPSRRAGTRPGSRIGGQSRRHIPDDRNLLYDLYWNRGMTLKEIGAQFGVTVFPAQNTFRELGIPVRPAYKRSVSITLAHRVEMLVPRSLPADIRAELCQELAIQILARKLKLADAEQAMAGLIRRAFKTCRGDYREISIDAPLGENGITLAELLEG